MSAWQELVKQALIGHVSNKKLSPLVLEQLTQYGLVITDKEPEKIILKAAALNSKLYAAAQIPRTKTDTITNVALNENLNYCSAKQKQQLFYILKYSHDEILIEFLELLQLNQKIVLPELLPELLQYGASRRFLQPLITDCIGNRGKWLAQFSPDWSYAAKHAEAQTEDIFFYGNREERLSYLNELHQSNPSQAISLLEQVWDSEGFTIKVDFIRVLQDSLVPEDEAFLEKALQDSRREVREPAANLLALLPKSKLVTRMQHLVKQLVIYDAKKDALLVELPASFTEAMKQDGIQPRKEFIKDHGPKANQLAQIISKIPPKWWVESFYKNPQQLLLLAAQTEWKNVFVWGWAMAAKNFNSSEWVLACHRYYLDTFFKQNWSNFSIDFLYQDLPNDLFNILAEEYLKMDNRPTLSDEHPIINFLLAEGQKWDDSISKTVIHRIQKTILQDNYVFQWSLKAILKRAAFSVNPFLFDTVKEGWPTNNHAWLSWQKEVDSMLEILKFRLEVIREA